MGKRNASSVVDNFRTKADEADARHGEKNARRAGS